MSDPLLDTRTPCPPILPAARQHVPLASQDVGSTVGVGVGVAEGSGVGTSGTNGFDTHGERYAQSVPSVPYSHAHARIGLVSHARPWRPDSSHTPFRANPAPQESSHASHGGIAFSQRSSAGAGSGTNTGSGAGSGKSTGGQIPGGGGGVAATTSQVAPEIPSGQEHE